MGNPVVHFEVVGKDAKKLRDFYARAFEWTIDPPMGGPMDYALAHPTSGCDAGPNINGGIGGLGASGDCGDGHVTFYVGVPDINAALAKVEELGGKRVMGPEVVPGQGFSIALFADPEDHKIGLVEIGAM